MQRRDAQANEYLNLFPGSGDICPLPECLDQGFGGTPRTLAWLLTDDPPMDRSEAGVQDRHFGFVFVGTFCGHCHFTRSS